MIQIHHPAKCCGCSACAAACPKDAITMEPDALGFLYPKVNHDLCINCGLCEKVCAFHDGYDKSMNLPAPSVYGVRHKNMQEIEKSRSGAVFVALSDVILNKGGVVYGAAYRQDFSVAHRRAETRAERDAFRGSKYVQSDMNSTFRQVRDDLKGGRHVLFSGTPCQVAGLRSFIPQKWQEKLYLVDIVCHGVPAPYVWRDYLRYMEKKAGKKLLAVDCRDKQTFGWTAHVETCTYTDGSKLHETLFRDLFYGHIILRHSCRECHFCNTTRPADVTIADFWGWQKTDSTLNVDDKGVSLVLCNTQKGNELFEEAREAVHSVPAQLENCLQPCLVETWAMPPGRDTFEADYSRRGFVYALRQQGYLPPPYLQRKLARLKKNLLRAIRKIIPAS